MAGAVAVVGKDNVEMSLEKKLGIAAVAGAVKLVPAVEEVTGTCGLV